MKCGLRVLVLGLFALAIKVQAVTVDGYAYLSGQSNHAAIEVLFYAVSPSAVTDSVYTDNAGHFSQFLMPGVYDVTYSHTGFANYPLPNQLLLFDTTLPAVTLMPPLSGSLSGNLGPGEFQVVDSITVDSDQALSILPGTRLYFMPRVRFVIRGYLLAQGDPGDSIVFSKRYAATDSLWGGIRFFRADSNSLMEYCIIEYGTPTETGYDLLGGGGVLIEYCNPTIEVCTIQHNVAVNGYSGNGNGGGGISCISANPVISQCVIADNYASDVPGGAIYVGGYTHPTIDQCSVQDNRSNNGCAGIYCDTHSYATITACAFQHNFSNYSGGGVSCYNDSATVIRGCSFVENFGEYGGGVSLRASNASVSRCVFAQNAGGYGAAVYVSGGSPSVTECTMTGDTAYYSYSGDVYLISANLVLSSCIIRNTVYGSGVYFDSHGDRAQIRYCDVTGNQRGAYDGEDSTNRPLGIGILALTNANGDSCDTYYNICTDPQFVDTANGDYHLRATSPCVDAGDPNLPRDPDGTIADIGAFNYPQPQAAGRNTDVRPREFALYQNYPNPFNATTRIAFDLPRAGQVALEVYDVTGRLAKKIASGEMAAGKHEFSVDGTNLASGIYFYRLRATGFEQTKKMALLK